MGIWGGLGEGFVVLADIFYSVFDSGGGCLRGGLEGGVGLWWDLRRVL